MTYKRADRVGDQIQREVSRMLFEEIKDPRIGMVTISGVEVSPDLRYAKIFYTCYGTEEERRESAAGLAKAAGFVRRQLGQHLRLRMTPEVSFHFDPSLDNAERISSILREIKERESDQGATDGAAGDAPEPSNGRKARGARTADTAPDLAAGPDRESP